MPAFRGTHDTVLGDSSSRNQRDRTRRHRPTPQYLQRVLYPRKPIAPPHRGDANEEQGQPRRRNLSLWEVHAETIQRREKRFRQEERRRIASSLPVAIVNPLHSQTVQTPRPADSVTLRSEAPRRPQDRVYEETPTEPDEETRTEVATEIDEQTERGSVVSEGEGDNDEVCITTTCAEKQSEKPPQRNLESERKSEQDLKQQAERFLRDAIGPCAGPFGLKMEEEQMNAQEKAFNPLNPPSQHQPNVAPQFVQGSSRDGEVGSGTPIQTQPEKVRDWLNLQSASHTQRFADATAVYYNPEATTLPVLSNSSLYPTPEPQPPAYYYTATPMDIIPLSNDLMDTSPDPEEIDVFTASSLVPPQPMRDIQPTSTRVADVSTISAFNISSTTPSPSFDGYQMPSNSFVSKPQAQWHLNAIHPRSLNVPAMRESYHSFPPPDWCTTCGQMLAFRQPFPLSESMNLSAPNHRMEGVGDATETEKERDVEPFIIEACEEQEAWWDMTAGLWTRATRSLWDSNSQNRVSVLDVTRPAHTRIIWRNRSTRRPFSSVDDTEDATRSLERFDEQLAQRVDTEALRRSYSAHAKVLASENKRTNAHRQKQRTRGPHRSPKQIYKSPRISQKRPYQRSFRTPIHRVLDDLTTIISRFPSVFL
ncbi:hypothetical protein E1B28_005681 [Marasmius oreades]|uniref:Uncharacterized protein n=1 Tax=Marasmius oreades TaxID=181124 RepID=A0A9P7S3R1_9AGAR|nr:uncharacterized protein E1B28_005681 [Marasmius oreades]KAG7094874.1 hypothetical protein E1B28_005681 [Marasmius oreades]